MAPAPSNAERRAKGMRRLEAWISREQIERLDALALDSGYSRAELITALIDRAWEELTEIREARKTA